MCAPASFVVTKDKVFWSAKSESHAEIIEEHKLHADGASGPNIAKVEVNPPNGDFTLPLDEWLFKLDEDVQPKWYDPAAIKAMVRAELPKWVAAKIVLPGETRKVVDGHIVACYGTIQSVEGGTIQSVKGGTIQYVYGGTIQYVYGGTIQSVEGGTIQSVKGGTIQYVYGGTIQYV